MRLYRLSSPVRSTERGTAAFRGTYGLRTYGNIPLVEPLEYRDDKRIREFSVTLPDSITHIGPYAFYHCTNLTSITLPDAISALPAGVFGDCSRLTSVHLPEQLQALGYLPRPTDQIMPDVGTFAGCHALKQADAASTA